MILFCRSGCSLFSPSTIFFLLFVIYFSNYLVSWLFHFFAGINLHTCCFNLIKHLMLNPHACALSYLLSANNLASRLDRSLIFFWTFFAFGLFWNFRKHVNPNSSIHGAMEPCKPQSNHSDTSIRLYCMLKFLDRIVISLCNIGCFFMQN